MGPFGQPRGFRLLLTFLLPHCEKKKEKERGGGKRGGKKRFSTSMRGNRALFICFNLKKEKKKGKKKRVDKPLIPSMLVDQKERGGEERRKGERN